MQTVRVSAFFGKYVLWFLQERATINTLNDLQLSFKLSKDYVNIELKKVGYDTFNTFDKFMQYDIICLSYN